MTTDYEKFEEHMREQDAKFPSPGRKVSVGQKDEQGNLLILGGHRADLWRSKNGLYFIAGDAFANSEQAMELYNSLNETKLPLDYVWKGFQVWYEKQLVVVANVPSRTDPTRTYAVRRNPSGELTCECQGWMYRGYCWHTEAVKELSSA